MSTTLECRLLCASVTAYGVQNDGTIANRPPYDQAVGFTDNPTGFAAGDDRINACLVGTNADGVLLAFRGTLPPTSADHRQTLLDWVSDLHAELIKVDGVPGRVHEGFWSALDSLWPQITPEIKKRLNQGGGKKLYITGHSKGGSMAHLAALRLAVVEGINASVCTFAGAHPADEDFAAAYDNAIAATRYEYADDIVPHLPPSPAILPMFASIPSFSSDPQVAGLFQRADLNYASVGTLKYINRDGAIVGDSATLRFTRFESLAKLIARLSFETIVKDHASACGGGYMSAVCPTDVCPAP